MHKNTLCVQNGIQMLIVGAEQNINDFTLDTYNWKYNDTIQEMEPGSLKQGKDLTIPGYTGV